jgi:hypothetical protein
MRRLLSILLLAAFALPLVAPLLALAQDPDSGLPACCRRHGQHHCMMLDRPKDPSAHRVVAVCPMYPQHKAAFVTGAHTFAFQPPQRAAVFSSVMTPTARAETNRRIARDRVHSERGPPRNSFAIS